jgi:nitrite reductase/ring-hydroxylating ferredoxin subunit
VGGLALAVFATDGEVFAVANQCAHRDVPLDAGLVDAGCVSCPWHGWRFDLTTGEHLTSFGRRQGLLTYPVRIADNTVWVDPEPRPAMIASVAARGISTVSVGQFSPYL